METWKMNETMDTRMEERKSQNFGHSDLNCLMQEDQKRRDQEMLDEIRQAQMEELNKELKEYEWYKEKYNKAKRKIKKMKKEERKLITMIHDLKEKNKKLGWIIFERQNIGEKESSKSKYFRTTTNSILSLLEADISDEF